MTPGDRGEESKPDDSEQTYGSIQRQHSIWSDYGIGEWIHLKPQRQNVELSRGWSQRRLYWACLRRTFFEKISIKRPLFFSMSLINSSSIPRQRTCLTLNHVRPHLYWLPFLLHLLLLLLRLFSHLLPTLSPQITASSANITAHRDSCLTWSARLSITIATKTGLLIPGISSIPLSYCYHGPIYRLLLPERKKQANIPFAEQWRGRFFKGKLPTVRTEYKAITGISEYV